MEDHTEFVQELSLHLMEKCAYGDSISALSGPERVVYVTQMLELEVNNGGFSQYFFNSSGNEANELVDAYIQLGAPKTAAICQRAIDAYGHPIPTDWEERRDMLEQYETDDVCTILDECDTAFFAYEENLLELTYDYVMEHRSDFS